MIGNRALFVSYSAHLRGRGGVQLCTNEFIAALEAAGIALDVLAVEPDRRLSTRLLRRAVASPYFRPLSAASLAAIRSRAAGARFVFLNQMSLAGGLTSEDVSDVPMIGLSHGCEITDQVHLRRLHNALPLTASQLRPHPALALARTLKDEGAARAALAAVIAISPFDADCERWLGVSRVCWIPRTVAAAPLARRPVAGRFGYVGTLDHAPNLEGLVAILAEFDRAGLQNIVVRIVGGPERLGRWLAARYTAVAYLGPLDDNALAAEAVTWNGFVHPIFCLPRGCSTKLAGALAWGLPVVTTPQGRRGYEWRVGALLEVDNPAAFVAAMRSLADPSVDAAAAAGVACVAASSPTIAETAARISLFLRTIGEALPIQFATDTAK